MTKSSGLTNPPNPLDYVIFEWSLILFRLTSIATDIFTFITTIDALKINPRGYSFKFGLLFH